MIEHVLDADVRTVLDRLGWAYEPCGSRVTCDPPPMDTDRDWLVTRPGASTLDVGRLMSNLPDNIRLEGGGEHYQQQVAGDFMSMRRGDLNLIVSSSAWFIERHREATRMCRELNLMEKRHRILLFQQVLYGRDDNHPLARAAVEKLDTRGRTTQSPIPF